MKSDAKRFARGEPIAVVAGGALALGQPALRNEMVGVGKVFGGAVDGEGSDGESSL